MKVTPELIRFITEEDTAKEHGLPFIRQSWLALLTGVSLSTIIRYKNEEVTTLRSELTIKELLESIMSSEDWDDEIQKRVQAKRVKKNGNPRLKTVKDSVLLQELHRRGFKEIILVGNRFKVIRDKITQTINVVEEEYTV